MSFSKPLITDGQAYDLSHLLPFTFQVQLENFEEAITVLVSFNNHCFTEAYDPAVHVEVMPEAVVKKYEKRAFNKERYELSKRLPDIIKSLTAARVSQSFQGTYVRVTLEDGKDYGVFFSLQRKGARLCELFVVSSYPLNNPKTTIKTFEMRFKLALAKVMTGKKLKFLPK